MKKISQLIKENALKDSGLDISKLELKNNLSAHKTALKNILSDPYMRPSRYERIKNFRLDPDSETLYTFNYMSGDGSIEYIIKIGERSGDITVTTPHGRTVSSGWPLVIEKFLNRFSG